MEPGSPACRQILYHASTREAQEGLRGAKQTADGSWELLQGAVPRAVLPPSRDARRPAPMSGPGGECRASERGRVAFSLHAGSCIDAPHKGKL